MEMGDTESPTFSVVVKRMLDEKTTISIWLELFVCVAVDPPLIFAI